ncbi:MAG: hypothetical protein CME59_18775 [Halioglobus sp.]|nr:hypothetical protein [Halioglobus sp.]|tara:strand:+ start:307 stop:1422 length:1116 start_codon:yes stop_codon:yes gene_type:complete
MTITTESRTALHELIALLQEIDERWSGPEWNLASEADVADSHRALMHILEAALVGYFEQDPQSPDFRRIVTPSRKLTGDNSDAIYFDAPVTDGHTYVVHGNLQGAAYFSVTIEEGCADGDMATNTAGVLNNLDMDIDSNGNFTLYIGGEPRERNWLALTPEAARITTRHYFEQPQPAAAQPDLEPRLRIECLTRDATPAAPDDASIAAGIRRVAAAVRGRTLGMPPMANSEPPAFVCLTPNEFPAPVPPGDFGLAAFDAHYSMAPYFLAPDEALVITGRWPQCCFGNVCLWNRFQQTLDYRNRQVSLNRAQTSLEDDGSFRMILAHEDPGLPNWLDTEGKPLGLVFWRFFMVEGEVQTPHAEVVKLAQLAR